MRYYCYDVATCPSSSAFATDKRKSMWFMGFCEALLYMMLAVTSQASGTVPSSTISLLWNNFMLVIIFLSFTYVHIHSTTPFDPTYQHRSFVDCSLR